MAKYILTSIQHIIEDAFDFTEEKDKVNFNLICTVLIVLARNLHILHRKFSINVGLPVPAICTSRISISEVKISANNTSKQTKSIIRYNELKAAKVAASKSQLRVDLGVTGQLLGEIKKKVKNDTSYVVPHGHQKPIRKREGISKNKYEGKNITTTEQKNSAQTKDNLDLETIKPPIVDNFSSAEDVLVHKQYLNRKDRSKFCCWRWGLPTKGAQPNDKLQRASNAELKQPVGTKSALDESIPQSIVTREQYKALHDRVSNLMRRFREKKNTEIENFRTSVTLTNPMAVIQLSSRLENIEKTIHEIKKVFEEICKRNSPIKSQAKRFGEDFMKQQPIMFAMDQHVPTWAAAAHQQETTDAQTQDTNLFGVSSSRQDIYDNSLKSEFISPLIQDLGVQINVTDEKQVTMDEFQASLLKLYHEISKLICKKETKIMSVSENANNELDVLSNQMQKIIDGAAKLVFDFEYQIKCVADKLHGINVRLSLLLSQYQDELVTIHDKLETALNQLAECSDSNDNTEDINQLNEQFNNLEVEFSRTMKMHVKQDHTFKTFFHLLKDVRLQLDDVIKIKLNRDEFVDLLQNKVGFENYNQFVTPRMSDVFCGTYTKNINSIFTKLDECEILWQRNIDDQYKRLDMIVDKHLVQSLRDDIEKNVDKLRNKLEIFRECVGDDFNNSIQSEMAKKRLNCNKEPCLSCTSTLNLNLEVPVPKVPPLPLTPLQERKRFTVPMVPVQTYVCYPGMRLGHQQYKLLSKCAKPARCDPDKIIHKCAAVKSQDIMVMPLKPKKSIISTNVCHVCPVTFQKD